MKKIFVIPLLVLYMVASLGIHVTLHYCGDTIESWAIASKTDGCEDDSCDDESTPADNCCKEKIIKSQVASEQITVSPYKVIYLSTTALLPAPFTYALQNAALLIGNSDKVIHDANAPPGNWQSIPLYKLFSSFTYYG